MAGTRQFDLNDVLGRATSTFWRRGYEATSIHDLVAATGINRGSIYATFGDKKGLFLAALDHYAETVAGPLIAELSDPDPRRGLQGMFDSIIRRMSDLSFPRGCLFTNTSLECPLSGDEITRKIAERVSELESAIYKTLRRGQSSGFVDPALDPKALARLLIGVVQGMNVLNKTVGDPDVLRDMARTAMSLLDASHGSARKRLRRPRLAHA